MDTREAIAERIERLRQERGRALLDGQPFDDAQIEKAKSALDALSDAESERLRRQRKAEAEAREKHIAKQRRELARYQSSFLESVAEAEAGARQLRSGISTALDTYRKIVAVVADLTPGRGVPAGLATPNLVNRFSGRIAAVMQTVPGHRARLGGLLWSGASLFKASDDWADAEQSHLHRTLEPLQGDKANGSDKGKGS